MVELLYAVGFFLFAAHVHWLAVNCIWKNSDADPAKARPPLFDFGLQWMTDRAPRLLRVLQMPGWQAVPAALCVLSMVDEKFRTKQGLVHHFVAHGAALLLRCATFSGTLLPDVTQEFKPPKLPWLGATYDLCFSGHTAFAVLCLCHVLSSHAFGGLLKAVAAVVTCFYGASLVARRQHYTFDVVVAAWAMPLLWHATESFLRA